MKLKKLLKNNTKLYAIMAVIIILGTIGITYAIVIGSFNAIAINTTSSVIGANITYDEGTAGAEIINTGNMLPISDNLVSLDVTDTRVLKVKFNVSGVDANPDNTIYDIAMYFNEIDCELRTTDLKWRLYKNDNLLSEGNLSPTFDTMANNRLVLTNTQEDLTTSTDKYTFLLWISESCDSSITECDASMDQSQYLNKILNGSIKIELSTKSKKELVRTTGSEYSCEYIEAEVPVCNSLTYDGNSQTLVNSNGSYTLISNTGTNAGSYNVILDLEDGYKWSDGSTDNKVISCDIDRKDVTITTLDQSVKYRDEIANSINNVNVSGLLNGHSLNTVSLNSSIYGVGIGVVNASNAVIVDSSGNDVTSNYNIKYINSGILTIDCLNMSVLPSVTDKEYTGEELTGITGGEYVDISGTKSAIDIGNYSVTVVPKDNYCWSDGTTTEKTLEWKILSDVVIINLDNEDADTTGSTSIYVKNNNVCLDEDCNNIMGTTTNNIEVPSRIGYTFVGYYTEENGSGTEMKTSDGDATSSLLSSGYEEEVTLYAYWITHTYTINFYENTDYIYEADTLLVTIGGRSFYKKYDGGALLVYIYDEVYTGPALIGTTADSVAYYQTYDNTIVTSAGTFTYDGVTYYYSRGEYWMQGDYTDTSGLNRTKYNETRGDTTEDAILSVAPKLLASDTSTVSQSFTYGSSQNLTSNSYSKEGYTFVGWSTIHTGSIVYTDGQSVKNLTSTNGDVINLYAVWEANSYNITTYYYNKYQNTTRNIFDTKIDVVNYGSTFKPYSITAPTGYYLSSNVCTYESDGVNSIWCGTVDSDSFVVTEDTRIHVIYYPNSYTISYDANGGSGAPSSQTKYYATTLTLSSTIPTRSGYTFLGWSTSSSATSATYAAGGAYTSNEAATLYAVWTDGGTYSSYEITNVSSSGYDVYVYGVTEPTGINYVTFPTWTSSGGQDDITWHAGTSQGNGTYYYRVNISDHNYETGTYYTHVYVYDTSGNKTPLFGTTITVPASTRIKA